MLEPTAAQSTNYVYQAPGATATALGFTCDTEGTTYTNLGTWAHATGNVASVSFEAVRHARRPPRVFSPAKDGCAVPSTRCLVRQHPDRCNLGCCLCRHVPQLAIDQQHYVHVQHG